MCVLTQMSGTLRALSSGAPAWTSPGSCKQTQWDTGSERVTSEIQTSEKCTLREAGEGWDAGATPHIPHVLSCLCSHGLRLMVKVVPEPRAMAAGVWRLSANQASQAEADGYMFKAGRAGPQLLAISTIHSWFLFTLLGKIAAKTVAKRNYDMGKILKLIAKKYLQGAAQPSCYSASL